MLFKLDEENEFDKIAEREKPLCLILKKTGYRSRCNYSIAGECNYTLKDWCKYRKREKWHE